MNIMLDEINRGCEVLHSQLRFDAENPHRFCMNTDRMNKS